MLDQRDAPGVIIFPPLIALAVLVVGIAIDCLLPLDGLTHVPRALRLVLGPILLAAGIALAIAGERAFKPFQPSLTFASQGIYAHLRNPMYVGMLAAVLGIVLLFGLEWTLLFALAGALVMHFGGASQDLHPYLGTRAL
jgi:protein-S-isoprenylcysteine O-methyltransferase Ste14